MKLWPSICLDKKLLKLWRSIFHWWGGVKWKSNIRQSWFLGKCCNKNLFVVDWIKIEINACADHNCQLRRRGKPEVVWVPDTATAKSSKCLRTQSRSCLKNIATIKSARHSCQKFKILKAVVASKISPQLRVPDTVAKSSKFFRTIAQSSSCTIYASKILPQLFCCCQARRVCR